MLSTKPGIWKQRMFRLLSTFEVYVTEFLLENVCIRLRGGSRVSIKFSIRAHHFIKRLFLVCKVFSALEFLCLSICKHTLLTAYEIVYEIKLNWFYNDPWQSLHYYKDTALDIDHCLKYFWFGKRIGLLTLQVIRSNYTDRFDIILYLKWYKWWSITGC